jgi:hypothetical protein
LREKTAVENLIQTIFKMTRQQELRPKAQNSPEQQKIGKISQGKPFIEGKVVGRNVLVNVSLTSRQHVTYLIYSTSDNGEAAKMHCLKNIFSCIN